MNGLIQDLRYAARQLRKNPGFTAVAVVTLALGIGANTGIFTVVNGLLLKMLPVREPQRLVVVGDSTLNQQRSNGTPRTDVFSYPLYRELRDRSSVFTGLCAAASDHHIEVDTGQGEVPDEKITGRMVSGNYFTVLGLAPAVGRLFSEADDTAEGANPAVVHHRQRYSPERVSLHRHRRGAGRFRGRYRGRTDGPVRSLEHAAADRSRTSLAQCGEHFLAVANRAIEVKPESRPGRSQSEHGVSAGGERRLRCGAFIG